MDGGFLDTGPVLPTQKRGNLLRVYVQGKAVIFVVSVKHFPSLKLYLV